MRLPCSCRSLLRLSKRRATLTAANYFLSRFALIFIREDRTMMTIRVEMMVKMILVLIMTVDNKVIDVVNVSITGQPVV